MFSFFALLRSLGITLRRGFRRLSTSISSFFASLRSNAAAAALALHHFRAEHPKAAKAAGVGLLVVGGIVVIPAILVGILNLLGFSAGGVTAASAAAGIQSLVYGAAVPSGSLFALAQAAAMGKVVVAPVAVQWISACAMGLGAWLFGE
ncbi:hypothetical protein B0H11DRAFT_566047 [Mycena galericulata]|nr:hypothetical protein B0H11DRAFT_566047 [Mycena galericulata]